MTRANYVKGHSVRCVGSDAFPLKINDISGWIKVLFIIQNDAHNYEITGTLKQLKFRLSLRHVSVHAGTIIRELFRA